jgi:DNA-binding NarL/FixJ family response regulator
MHDNPALVQRLVGLGIGGYLHKSVTRATLISAIRAAREEATSVITAVSRQSVSAPPAKEMDVSLLSSRELQVLGYVSSAMSNRQIASRLGITEGTVKRHMQNIFRKLNAVSRLDAVNKARSVTIMHNTGEPSAEEDSGGVVA